MIELEELRYCVPPFSITCLAAATVAKGCKSRDALRALECRTGLLYLSVVRHVVRRVMDMNCISALLDT